MRRIGFWLLAIGNIPLVAIPSAEAAERPRYGGVLRVELRARVATLDPRRQPADAFEAAAKEKLASLVFERLVSLDEYGRVQPQLAVAWQHDAESKRWQFTVRNGSKFRDGKPLTPADVAAALQPLVGEARQVSVSGPAVVIACAQPAPDLLLELASGFHYVFRELPDGTLSGTGPFRVAQWPAESASDAAGRGEASFPRAAFLANDDAWSGRPFLDAVEVTMGVPPGRQLMDLQLGKTDIAELGPDLTRRAAQAGVRTWVSSPVDLLALVFDRGNSAGQDARLRQAVALTMNRTTLVNVLLQKQGEAAERLLPQWLSGYAFLFAGVPEPERARQLRAEIPRAIGSTAAPLQLRVEPSDETARLVAERVAVNARQAGIVIQVTGRVEGRSGSVAPEGAAPAVRLVRRRIATLAARAELEAIAASLGANETPAIAAPAGDGAEWLARERALLEGGQIIPLVYLPEVAGLSGAVRNWMPKPWGAWRLEEVWLDRRDAPPSAEPTGARQ